MSVLDRFLNVMKLNDDDDYDDEGYLDDDVKDLEDEPRPKRRITRQKDEDDDLFPDSSHPVSATSENSSERPAARTTRSTSPSRSSRQSSAPAKIAPIRPRRRGEAGMEVCVIRPHSMEDAREITETLLANCTVVLNVEGLELEIAQRIIDFASGSCYAIDGNLQKISSYIFIITPSSVDISGDFQEILSGAFDVPFEKKY